MEYRATKTISPVSTMASSSAKGSARRSSAPVVEQSIFRARSSDPATSAARSVELAGLELGQELLVAEKRKMLYQALSRDGHCRLLRIAKSSFPPYRTKVKKASNTEGLPLGIGRMGLPFAADLNQSLKPAPPQKIL